MGNNQAFTAFEAAVIRLYDSGQLTRTSLTAVAEPYRNTDIDHGGCHDLVTRDGLGVREVVVKTMAPDIWDALHPLRALQTDDAREVYADALGVAEYNVEWNLWGWR